MRRTCLLITPLIALLAPGVASADTRFAEPGGNGPVATCPQADPCSLQAAVENAAAGDGDEIVVLPGTYTESNELVIDDALTVHGGTGANLPQINTTAQPGVTVDDPAAILRDVSVAQTAGINALVVRAGLADRVRIRTSQANSCALSGPANLVTLRNSTCLNTSSGGNAIAATVGGPIEVGGVVRNVSALATGASGNGLESQGISDGDSVLDVRNTILVGGANDLKASSDATGSATVTIANSNFDLTSISGPNTTVTPLGTNGNQLDEPVMFSPASGDFTQLPSSPTIDAGARDASIGTQDINGDPRVQNGVPDIGADEFPDSVAPQTTIDSGPAAVTADDTPTFAFSSNEFDATFTCSIDGAAAAPCSPPFTAPSLGEGAHTFRVTAVDAANIADPTPAELTFTVDRSVSGAGLSAKRKQGQGEKVVVKLKARAGESARVSPKGTITVGGRKLALKGKTANLPAAGKRKLKLKPKRASDAAKILDALGEGEKVTASLSARFTDALGNQATVRKVKVTLE